MCVVIPYNLIELESKLIASYIKLSEIFFFHFCRLYSIKVLGLFDASEKKKLQTKKMLCRMLCTCYLLEFDFPCILRGNFVISIPKAFI